MNVNSQNGDLGLDTVERIAHTVLYEGYALYPYHRSAIKNRKPIPLGVVYPKEYLRHHPEVQQEMQTECIVSGPREMLLNVSMRFLQLRRHTTKYKFPEDREVGWDCLERTVESGPLQVNELLDQEKRVVIRYSKQIVTEDLKKNGQITGYLKIQQAALRGALVISLRQLPERAGCYKLTVRLENTTFVTNASGISRDAVFDHSFLSSHLVLRTQRGVFVSILDPHEEWKSVTSQCHNENLWPVLIDKQHTTMLASPMILYDYPQIDARSTGDLFDSTEMEEALLLHIAVMSEEEKRQLALRDEKMKTVLDRIDTLSQQQFESLHNGMQVSDAMEPDVQKSMAK